MLVLTCGALASNPWPRVGSLWVRDTRKRPGSQSCAIETDLRRWTTGGRFDTGKLLSTQTYAILALQSVIQVLNVLGGIDSQGHE